MMDTAIETDVKPFISASEVWVPEGDRLILAEGDYGDMDAFAAASRRESFALGEGLPGKAWAEARPVVLKGFDGSYFKRTEAAKAAGLTSAVAIPVFAGNTLKSVLVLLCAADDVRTGAIELCLVFYAGHVRPPVSGCTRAGEASRRACKGISPRT